jgi:hypothetical protein
MSGCNDHSHATLDQISGKECQSIEMVIRPAIFDCDVAALDVTRVVQAVSDSSDAKDTGLRRSRA